MNQVSGGLGFGSLMNTMVSNTVAFMASDAGGLIAFNGLVGGAGYVVGAEINNEEITGAGLVGSIATGMVGGAVSAVGTAGKYLAPAASGIGGAAVGKKIENLLNNSSSNQKLRELDDYY